jgi:hypothetical protein
LDQERKVSGFRFTVSGNAEIILLNRQPATGESRRYLNVNRAATAE